MMKKRNLGAINNFFIKDPPRVDLSFIIIFIILALFGTVMVFSASGPYSLARYGDPSYFMKRQIIWLLLGFLTALASSRIKPEVYKKITPILYVITILLLLLVLLVGFVGNGAKRWISIGPLTIQPSEIAKIAIVLMLAKYFSDYEALALEHKKRKTIFIYGTLFPILILLLPVVLVMLQKHLSCIIILSLLGSTIIVAAGIDLRYVYTAAGIGVSGITALALFTDYTKERIMVWRDPEAYKLTGGWQTLQGLMAIGSGGFFGVGFGNSVMKHCYVSEPANDMIFAILCEELGLFGGVAVLLMFALLILRGYTIALKAESAYSRLVAFGISTKIAIQTLLNVAVVTNTIPNTGISLPFFSYGGSSLIMICFEMGIIISISRYSKINK